MAQKGDLSFQVFISDYEVIKPLLATISLNIYFRLTKRNKRVDRNTFDH